MIIGVITARSGSKRVLDKNIRLVNGYPLIYYTIIEALKSKYLDEVIVSTDSKKYAEISQKYGAKAIIRPTEFSRDDSPTYKAVQHVVNTLEENGIEVTLAVTLQPTSPLRTVEDINACIEPLHKNPELYDSSATVCEVTQRPEWMFTIDKHVGYLIDYENPMLKADTNVESQLLPKIYVLNGLCYCTSKEALMKKNTIIGEKCKAVITPIERSLDVDIEEDFILLERLIK